MATSRTRRKPRHTGRANCAACARERTNGFADTRSAYLPVIVVPMTGHGGRMGNVRKVGMASTLAAAKAMARKSGHTVVTRGKRMHRRVDWSATYPDAWMVTVSARKPARR